MDVLWGCFVGRPEKRALFLSNGWTSCFPVITFFPGPICAVTSNYPRSPIINNSPSFFLFFFVTSRGWIVLIPDILEETISSLWENISSDLGTASSYLKCLSLCLIFFSPTHKGPYFYSCVSLAVSLYLSQGSSEYTGRGDQGRWAHGGVCPRDKTYLQIKGPP